MGCTSRSFRALLRRNAIYRKRRWVSSIFEFALPIAAVGILLGIKAGLKKGEGYTATTVPAVFPNNYFAFTPFGFQDYVTALQAKRICLQHDDSGDNFTISGIPFQGQEWPVPFVYCDSSKCATDGEDAAKYCDFPILAIAPSDSRIVNNFTSFVEKKYPQLAREGVLPFDHDFVQVFHSDADIERYVTSEDYGSVKRPRIGVAVVFASPDRKESANSYSYTIRVNSTGFNSPEQLRAPNAKTTPPTDRLFESYAKSDWESCPLEGFSPSMGLLHQSCTGQYYYNGAIAVQRLVDDWIMEHASAGANNGTFVAENGVTFVSFPTKEFVQEGVYAAIEPFAPLLIFLGLVYPVTACIRSMTVEKELRQKELMKMMSVTESALNWSWFASLYGFFFFSALATAAAATSLYAQSEFLYLFIFWQLTFLSSLTYAFVVSACFARSTRATLVGILVYFVGVFLVLALDYQTDSVWLTFLVSLHPVSAFANGLRVIGYLEDIGVGVTSSSFSYSDFPSGYGFDNACFFLMIDCVIWGLSSFYLNRVIRGDYGTPLPWYFPFLPTYWCPGWSRSDDGLQPEGLQDGDAMCTALIEPVSDALRQQGRDGRSIEMRSLTKLFGTNLAVDNLTLSIYSGQVTALLGHNGAGKTTVINILTGMLRPSSGYALVAGNDVRAQMMKIRRNEVGIGVCPQHNCLFPLLTVKEHMQFFARVKGVYDKKSREEGDEAVKAAIRDVALYDKRNTLSKELSGGMQRKLSVAIAFSGDSKIVFLDEPTSGMDPFSRRFTWNVIRQHRPDRCIILTTHFMEEADILGDRIAIMAEGQLRCVGSSLFLKTSFDVGYRLSIEMQAQDKKGNDNGTKHLIETNEADGLVQTPVATCDNLVAVVTNHVQDAKVMGITGTEIILHLPLDSSDKFSGMFELLDIEVENGNIVTYGVGITTLEEVFLKVARGEVGEKPEYASLRGSSKSLSPALPESTKSHQANMDLDERHLFSRHVQALFLKRAKNFKRDKKAWCCSTILPGLFAFLGFLIVKLYSPSQNMRPVTLSLSNYNSEIKSDRNPVGFNDPGNFSCQPGSCAFQFPEWDIQETEEKYSYCGSASKFGFDSCFSDYCGQFCSIEDSESFADQITDHGAFPVNHGVTGISESSHSIYNSSTSFAASQYGAVFFTHDKHSVVTSDADSPSYHDSAFSACLANHGNYTDISQCSNFKGIGYVISYNFTALHASLLFQALADEAIIRDALGDESYNIEATLHPLPITAKESRYFQAQSGLSAWLLIVISFPFIAGAFATFIVAERQSKAKHLQIVAGVKHSAYWISSYLWDIINYQFPLWIVVILLFAFGIKSYTTTDHSILGGTISILFLFGPAAAGATYCFTFLFDSPSKCNMFVIVFNVIIGLAGPMVTFYLRLFGSDPNLVHLSTISKALEWILRFFPSYCLGKALLYVQFIDVFSEVYQRHDINVWSSDILLIEVIYLAVESVLYLWFAVRLDKLSTKPRAVQKWRSFVHFITCRCFSERSTVLPSETADSGAPDDDVLAEAQRVKSGEAHDELIVLTDLTKLYADGTLAVDRLSLGIPNGECFGLLGINGAGKTTTMAMLTAEFPPTSGDATLAGFSVTREPEQTRRRIGYCPQFDAHFMNMTGREHIELYASIKGIPKNVVKETAKAQLMKFGLSEKDGDRLSSQYSGGMKRKLSVACSAVGRPQIVFLDEPSTGMDPVARRELWQVISDMVAGDDSQDLSKKTSIILTTHSMEECEALCPRLGIMALGKLRCLGSAQHLKSKFGQGYQVEAKLKLLSPDDSDYQSTVSRIVLLALQKSAPHEEVEADIEAADAPITAADSIFASLEQARDMVEALTGDKYLSMMINANDPTGYIIYRYATSDVGVAMDELAAFCTEELRIKAIQDFFKQTYTNSVLRERQENKLRFEVGSEGLTVSKLFETIEGNKERLKVEDYGVSQTSLEQVFNMHAAEAEKAIHGTGTE